MKVIIIECDTNSTVEEINCSNYENAIKVEMGININLNHERFYTEIKD